MKSPKLVVPPYSAKYLGPDKDYHFYSDEIMPQLPGTYDLTFFPGKVNGYDFYGGGQLQISDDKTFNLVDWSCIKREEAWGHWEMKGDILSLHAEAPDLKNMISHVRAVCLKDRKKMSVEILDKNGLRLSLMEGEYVPFKDQPARFFPSDTLLKSLETFQVGENEYDLEVKSNEAGATGFKVYLNYTQRELAFDASRLDIPEQFVWLDGWLIPFSVWEASNADPATEIKVGFQKQALQD